MEFQQRHTDLPAPDLGMGFGWQPDVYSKFMDNSHYPMDAPSTSMSGMPDQLDVKPT
jgi:hypothetical protein